jgi:hypothetical protein
MLRFDRPLRDIMKIRIIRFVFIFLGSIAIAHAQYHTNTITTPGGIFAFSVDDSPATNPVIQLQAGVTNILDIQTDAFHPVIIITTNTFENYSGANPQDVNDEPITLTTPTSGFPANLYYMCSIHGFFGQINIVPPPATNEGPPPPNTILQVMVGTNIVMTSTGANTTWHLVPEFTSNLVDWATVPNFTNTFANGTNITVFDRLDPICGPDVFLRLRQQQN